jgi:hypothetical protein
MDLVGQHEIRRRQASAKNLFKGKDRAEPDGGKASRIGRSGETALAPIWTGRNAS